MKRSHSINTKSKATKAKSLASLLKSASLKKKSSTTTSPQLNTNNDSIDKDLLLWKLANTTQHLQRTIWNILLLSLVFDFILLSAPVKNFVLANIPLIPDYYGSTCLILAALLSSQTYLVKSYQKFLHWYSKTSAQRRYMIMATGALIILSFPIYELISHLANANLWGITVVAIAILGHFISGNKSKTTTLKQSPIPEEQEIKFLAHLILTPAYLARLGSLLITLALTTTEQATMSNLIPYLVVATLIILCAYPEKKYLIDQCRICAESFPQSRLYQFHCKKCRNLRPGL